MPWNISISFNVSCYNFLKVNDLSFQQKYKEEFEKSKGKIIGLKGLQDDLNMAHSVYANKLQSDVSAP